jgi:hypothetical protein
MGFLMARRAEGDQILSSVIAQSAPRLNVMDLKILHAPARLATPSISLQNFTAELAICFRFKPQAGPFWLGSASKRHPHFFKELFSLRLRKTSDQPGKARQ